MKLQTLNILLLAFIASSISLSSCKKDDDDPDDHDNDHEEELITTVSLSFSKSGAAAFTAEWSDPDGPGGNDPVIDTITLDTNSTYEVGIEFLDESGDEVEDVTHEIEEEASEHIVCIDPSSDGLTVVRTDSDGTYEIGLSSEWITTSNENLNIVISLKHQPNTKDGTCDPGETDIEVEFPVVIQ